MHSRLRAGALLSGQLLLSMLVEGSDIDTPLSFLNYVYFSVAVLIQICDEGLTRVQPLNCAIQAVGRYIGAAGAWLLGKSWISKTSQLDSRLV